jgi:DnaJ-domain-containing protein 1
VYLVILIAATVVGGPIGFIIGLGICGYLMYQKEQVNLNVEQDVSSNHSTSNSHTSSKSHISQIEVLAPCINILGYFALKYEPEWTPEKVRYIKHLFSDICSTESDHLYLREQLKGKGYFFFDQNIKNWLSQNPSIDDRRIIFEAAVKLLVNTCNSINDIRADSFNFGEKIGLGWKYCNDFLADIFDDHTDNYSTDNNYNSKEEAAKILDVSVNASIDEIQKAYRLKIREFHPDRNANVTDAVREMLNNQTKLINEARDTLLQGR